jgi:hypothetical protein
MYDHLCSSEINNPNWKAKIPLKVQIFMWLIQQEAILTKDNLAKKELEWRQ